MTKTVVDVGNCDFDHGSLRDVLETHFQATLIQTHSADEALQALRSQPVDLLLVNRKFDRDQGDGLELIKRIRSEPELAGTPCMLISNFAEYQAQAVEAGAEMGFGKQRLQESDTRDLLAKFLAP